MIFFKLNAAHGWRKRSLSRIDVTRNHLINRHKMTIGTDFDQFCAACELIFSRPIKCCSRIYNIRKMLSWNKQKINAAQEITIYKNSDSTLISLQSAAARWHQRPNWPWNHVFEKSRYLSYFSYDWSHFRRRHIIKKGDIFIYRHHTERESIDNTNNYCIVSRTYFTWKNCDSKYSHLLYRNNPYKNLPKAKLRLKVHFIYLTKSK